MRQKRKLLRPWSGIVFRATTLEFARSEKLIDGKGAYRHGSRWCAPRAFRCVNFSTAEKTALDESHANSIYYGFDKAVLHPRVVVNVSLTLRKVLNLLTNPTLARELALADMLKEDWHGINDGGSESLGQALGRAAHDLGAEAIVVPSARVKEAVNIVIFPEILIARSRMEVIGPEELDRWLKKK